MIGINRLSNKSGEMSPKNIYSGLQYLELIK